MIMATSNSNSIIISYMNMIYHSTGKGLNKAPPSMDPFL
jgi:hypothetical protein